MSKKTTNGSNSKCSRVSAKKPIVIIESDDEDVVEQTPERPIAKQLGKRKIKVISSDSEDEKPKIKKSPAKKSKENEEKLIPISIDDYFGDKPIKMSNIPVQPEKKSDEIEMKVKSRKKKKSKNPELGVHGDSDFDKTLEILDKDESKKSKHKSKHSELGVHGDKDFEKTLEELDDDDLINNMDILDKTIEEATKKEIPKENLSNQSKKATIDSNSTPTINKNGKKRQRKDSEGKENKFV